MPITSEKVKVRSKNPEQGKELLDMLFNSFWARKEIPRLYFFQITSGGRSRDSEIPPTGVISSL